MKRFAAVALLVAWFALPVCAQRGGGGHGGGFGGHFSGGFHGGFGGHASGGFRGGVSSPRFSAPRYSTRFAARPYGYYGRPGYGASTSRAFRSYNNYNHNYGYNRNHAGFRAPYRREGRGAGRFRSPYFSGYGFPFFAYGLPDWIGIGPVGCYPDFEIYDNDNAGDYGPWCDQQLAPEQGQNQDQDQPTIYGNDGYYGDGGTGSPEYAPPANSPPQYAPPPPADQPLKAPADEIVTMIIFKDGRPAEQVHNYALTPSMLYVLDRHKQDIPVGQIDLAATEKANRAAGIEFQIPVSAQ